MRFTRHLLQVPSDGRLLSIPVHSRVGFDSYRYIFLNFNYPGCEARQCRPVLFCPITCRLDCGLPNCGGPEFSTASTPQRSGPSTICPEKGVGILGSSFFFRHRTLQTA